MCCIVVAGRFLSCRFAMGRFDPSGRLAAKSNLASANSAFLRWRRSYGSWRHCGALARNRMRGAMGVKRSSASCSSG